MFNSFFLKTQANNINIILYLYNYYINFFYKIYYVFYTKLNSSLFNYGNDGVDFFFKSLFNYKVYYTFDNKTNFMFFKLSQIIDFFHVNYSSLTISLKPSDKNKTNRYVKQAIMTYLYNNICLFVNNNYSSIRYSKFFTKTKFSRNRQLVFSIVFFGLFINIFFIIYFNSVYYQINVNTSYMNVLIYICIFYQFKFFFFKKNNLLFFLQKPILALVYLL
jgi:hypothetical protein